MKQRTADQRRGIATVIGITLILGTVIITVAATIGLQASYQWAVTSKDNLDNRIRAESFLILSSPQNGTQLVVYNSGQNLLHIVSLYVNHVLTQTLSINILPGTSGTILTGTLMHNGDIIDLLSDLGNRATATYPVLGPAIPAAVSNTYVGTGPLGIIFQSWSFLYQNYTGTGSCNPPPASASAWAGLPGFSGSGIAPIFWVGIVNHGLGNITLLNSTNLNLVSISTSSQSVNGYFIVGSNSTPCKLVQYSKSTPYLIPQNRTGDIAAGGPPVIVGFAANTLDCDPNKNNCAPTNLWNAQSTLVAAAFISTVFIWQQKDAKGVTHNVIFSEDIPFATLRICAGACT